MFKAAMMELANSIYVVVLIGTFLGFKQVVLTTFGVQEVGTFGLASVKCLVGLVAWGSAIFVFIDFTLLCIDFSSVRCEACRHSSRFKIFISCTNPGLYD